MSDDQEPIPGQAMQKAFVARGYDMSIDEARHFVETLLALFELGALAFYDAEDNVSIERTGA